MKVAIDRTSNEESAEWQMVGSSENFPIWPSLSYGSEQLAGCLLVLELGPRAYAEL